MNPSSIDASWLPIKPQPKRVIPTEAARRLFFRTRSSSASGCVVEGSWQHANPAHLAGTKPPTDPPVIPNAHMNLSSIAASWHPTSNQSKNVSSRPEQPDAFSGCVVEGSWQHVNPAHLDGTKPPTDPPVTPHHPRASIAPSPYLQLAPSPPAPHFASKTKSKIAIYVGPDTLLPPTSRFTLCATTRS